MKSRLDRIESRLQSIIENRLPWLRGKNHADHIARQLLDAFRTNLDNDSAGLKVAPDDYALFFAPERAAAWQGQPDVLDQLVLLLEDEARENGVHFRQPVTLRLFSQPDLAGDAMRVEATFKPLMPGDTASLPVKMEPVNYANEAFPANAFLILYGNQVYPLNQSVINIGRRADNHLVIDDPRISRSHAQIRSIQGNFVLFDLNSTGGTYANNQRITQWTLQPGDVISLSGVNLIYGEDASAGSMPSTGSTSQFKP